MTVLRLDTKTDENGSIRLDTGIPNAKVHATVVVEETEVMSDENRRREWEAFILRTRGSIQDPTFRRHPQGEFPKRDSL